VLRFLPAYIVTEADVDKAVQILDRVLQQAQAANRES
jgi:acetylornithine/succinyldiaminopimelate/putrescine aminotransferase